MATCIDAERAPPLQDDKEYWCLPSFGVYHPQTPGQFALSLLDSSAQFGGVSLNMVLLSEPDLSNEFEKYLEDFTVKKSVLD